MAVTLTGTDKEINRSLTEMQALTNDTLGLNDQSQVVDRFYTDGSLAVTAGEFCQLLQRFLNQPRYYFFLIYLEHLKSLYLEDSKKDKKSIFVSNKQGASFEAPCLLYNENRAIIAWFPKG